jgi:aminoglycoside/choline kinase family phosphotransferase
MDQPPSLESVVCPPGASDAERVALGYNAAARLAAGSVAAFVATAAYLRARPVGAQSWPTTSGRAWRCWRTWATASTPG